MADYQNPQDQNQNRSQNDRKGVRGPDSQNPRVNPDPTQAAKRPTSVPARGKQGDTSEDKPQGQRRGQSRQYPATKPDQE